MKIIPSIDIIDGKCVRLKQGKPEDITVYPVSPVEYAKECVRNNLKYIHVVDLNRVFNTTDETNMSVIMEMLKIPGIKMQIGGGIDSVRIALEYLLHGVDRICLGSIVHHDPEKAKEIIRRVGAKRIVVCADFKHGCVVTGGWTRSTKKNVVDYITKIYNDMGVRTFLCTNVEHDGMLSGYSEEAYTKIRQNFPNIELIASGGCSSMSDVVNLKNVVDSCIVGKALMDNYVSEKRDYSKVCMSEAKDYTFVESVDFGKCGGLVPCIVQDYKTKDVLMLAYMDKEALDTTIHTRVATFYSRSRKEIWIKGKSHGKRLPVVDYKLDCDRDAILLLVNATDFGNICHLEQETCWGERDFTLEYLDTYIHKIKSGEIPSEYTKHLLDGGLTQMAKKVGEEAIETVIEIMKENKERVVYESADLIYHLIVMLNKLDIPFNDIVSELKKRHKKK